MGGLWCEVPVVGAGDACRYLVVTISNSRRGSPIADTEALFIPFKGQFENAGHVVAGGQGVCYCAVVVLLPCPLVSHDNRPQASCLWVCVVQ